MMKVPYTLFASVIAASTVITFSSIENKRDISCNCSNEGIPSTLLKNFNGSGMKSSEISVKEEKFVPKFDGLRFIETLVTAHR